jgi:hypothetical protein
VYPVSVDKGVGEGLPEVSVDELFVVEAEEVLGLLEFIRASGGDEVPDSGYGVDDQEDADDLPCGGGVAQLIEAALEAA